ncbi:MAG: 50S ribosomal protein L22 [Patescibacteria group bacterium]|nr:50S ribosomal protein L22 [Patescibacteria group bacterium]
MITASLKNHRISPRKVRLVADMVRGKKVAVAKAILANASKKARHPIAALIDSAVANASHNHKIDQASLVVKEIRVDQGYTLKRSIPMSRGSAFPMKKRTSHIAITLAPLAEARSKEKAERAKKVETKK